MPQLLKMRPDLKQREFNPYDSHVGAHQEWERAGGEAVRADRAFNDGSYLHQTLYFNRYRLVDPPQLGATPYSTLDVFGPEQYRVYEEYYDATKTVTVRETYKTHQKATMLQQYVEYWLTDAALDKYYTEVTSLPKGALVAAGDGAAGVMLYGGANPVSTLGGAVFTTSLYLTTLGYGWLTDWGRKLTQWEWMDFGYFLEKAPDVTVRVERSTPHKRPPSDAEKEANERLRRAMRRDSDEQVEYDRTHPRPAVEWASDEAYERQRALDAAKEKK